MFMWSALIEEIMLIKGSRSELIECFWAVPAW